MLMMIISRIHFPTTKNTIAFSIVTVIYIIAYLPTVCVETLNASGVYREEAPPYTIRSILVLMNVNYFLNNVCNQYVYSVLLCFL